MTYHATTWPLLLMPEPYQVLAFIDRDHGTTATSQPERIALSLALVGHDPASCFGQRVLELHRVRRFEALYGIPF